ncbi:MAG: hypothetical protein ACI9MR_003003, partial [Myxococcota bacterium]
MRLISKPLIGALLMLLSASASAAPYELAYRGTLTLDNGAPFVGDVQVELALFDTIEATVPVWGPVSINPLPVVDGHLDLVLGTAAQPPLTEAMAAECAFIEVTIDGVTLSPRQALVAVPYALRAVDADFVAGVPIDELVLQAELTAYAQLSQLGAAALSNSYNDLLDKPQLTQGPKGDTGETGQQGMAGPKGDTGPQGMAGPKGDTGDPGDPGDLTGYVQRDEAGSVSTAMVVDGAVTLDKLADSCSVGQVVRRTSTGWACGDPDNINVRDFGAVGDYLNDDGSLNMSPTDDTAAIQAAFDHAVRGFGGRVRPVYIPAGAYYISGTIELNYEMAAAAAFALPMIRVRGDGGHAPEPLHARGTVLVKDTRGAIMRLNEREDGQVAGGDDSFAAFKYLNAIVLEGISFYAPPTGGVPIVDGFVGRGIIASTFEHLGFKNLNYGIRTGHPAGPQTSTVTGFDLDYSERNTFRKISMRLVHTMIHLTSPDITVIEQCTLSQGINKDSRIVHISGGNDWVDIRNNIIHPFGTYDHLGMTAPIELNFTNGVRFVGNHVEHLRGPLMVGTARFVNVENNLLYQRPDDDDPVRAYFVLSFISRHGGINFVNNTVRLTPPTGPFFDLTVVGDDASFTQLQQLAIIRFDPNMVRDVLEAPWELTVNTAGFRNVHGWWRQPLRLGSTYVWVR